MIIEIINVVCIARVKAESDTPASRYPNSPVSFEFTFKRMQPKSREIHIIRFPTPIQNCKNIAQFNSVLRRHALFRLPFVQRFKAAMTK